MLLDRSGALLNASEVSIDWSVEGVDFRCFRLSLIRWFSVLPSIKACSLLYNTQHSCHSIISIYTFVRVIFACIQHLQYNNINNPKSTSFFPTQVTHFLRQHNLSRFQDPKPWQEALQSDHTDQELNMQSSKGEVGGCAMIQRTKHLVCLFTLLQKITWALV